MEGSTIVWIIVAIIVVGGIIAFVLSRSGGRRAEAERAKAAELRESAAEHDRKLREREASAAEVQARSDMARVEAQKRELEAERLAAEAQDRSAGAAAVRRERDEQLRLADLRDPDVPTDERGYRLDEHGNRLGGGDVLAHDDVDTPRHRVDTSRERLGDAVDDRRAGQGRTEALDQDRGDWDDDRRAGHEGRTEALDRDRGDWDDHRSSGLEDDHLSDEERDRLRRAREERHEDDAAAARDERGTAGSPHRDV